MIVDYLWTMAMLWYKSFWSWHARQHPDLLLPRFRADFCRLGRLQNHHRHHQTWRGASNPCAHILDMWTDVQIHDAKLIKVVSQKKMVQIFLVESGGLVQDSHKSVTVMRIHRATATTLLSYHILYLEDSWETPRLSANRRGNKTSENHISNQHLALHKHICGFLRLKAHMSHGRTFF